MKFPHLSRSKDSARCLAQLSQLMPANGDMEQFVAAVACFRNRPIHLHRVALPVGISGVWAPHEHEDFILVDAGHMPPTRYAAIVAHEIAHIVLEHKPASQQRQEGYTSVLDPDVAQRFMFRHVYEDGAEREAEELATQLTLEHGRRRRDANLRQNRVSARIR